MTRPTKPSQSTPHPSPPPPPSPLSPSPLPTLYYPHPHNPCYPAIHFLSHISITTSPFPIFHNPPPNHPPIKPEMSVHYSNFLPHNPRFKKPNPTYASTHITDSTQVPTESSLFPANPRIIDGITAGAGLPILYSRSTISYCPFDTLSRKIILIRV